MNSHNKPLQLIIYLLFGQDYSSKQLILQAAHSDREINYGGLGTNFRRVGRVTKLGGNVQPEAIHYIHFLVANFYLIRKYVKVRPPP